MKKERLIIKNFGPIVEAEIEIKPFMVFIGESGSGKSVILKLLSLFRWIYKKLALKSLSKSVGITKEHYRFRIERMLRESGLEDFCIKGSEAHYYMSDFCVSITCNGKLNLKYPKQTFNKIILEKISFITDDRFAIPLLVNNQIRGVSPYHLEKTFEDFEESFEHLQTNREVKIKIFDVKLSFEKFDIQNRFFLNFKDSKIQLHNTSSGMKSTSIIELIATYFATDKEYMKNKYTNFIVGIFSGLKNRNTSIFLESLRKVKINKERFSLFIEEPELSLFPNAQKRLVEYLVNLCFYLNSKKTIQVAFSTHSPYILSALNCLLEASAIFTKKPELKQEIEKILPKEYWLSIQNFCAYKVKDGKVKSIIDEETKLILADEIDEVSEEIGEIFDKLLDLEYD